MSEIIMSESDILSNIVAGMSGLPGTLLVASSTNILISGEPSSISFAASVNASLIQFVVVSLGRSLCQEKNILMSFFVATLRVLKITPNELGDVQLCH